MMKIDLARATTTEIKAAKGEYPIAAKFFVVALWDSQHRRWTLRNHQWESMQYAERYADTICQPRNGYTHYTIIEIDLPGAKI